MGSSDPEDEEVETDEVKAKQLADQEVFKIFWVQKPKIIEFESIFDAIYFHEFFCRSSPIFQVFSSPLNFARFFIRNSSDF